MKKTLEELYQKSCERFGQYPVGQRHPPLLGVAINAYNVGYCDEDALAEELKSMWAKYGQGAVDERDCQNTAKNVCKIMADKGHFEPKTVLTKEEKKEKSEREKKVHAHEARWRNWLKDILAKPVAVPVECEITSTKQTAELMREAIQKIVPNLQKGEYIYCGAVNWDKMVDIAYVSEGYVLSAPEEQCYWSPNRLYDKVHDKEHCDEFDYLLLEIDEELEPVRRRKNSEDYYDAMEQQQISLWEHLRQVLPVRSLVYSGGKSVHALIPVHGTPAELEQYRERLTTLYSELHFDTANIDAVRKTRTPFGLRKFYIAEDGTLVKDTEVDGLRWKLKSKSMQARADAKARLASLLVDDGSKVICRLQDCLLVDEEAQSLSLAEYADLLQSLVDEFVPSSDDPIEKAIVDGTALPLTTASVEAFLSYKGWRLWWDTTMMRAKLQTADGIEEDIETITNMLSDGWTDAFQTPPQAQKLTACIKQIYKAHSVSEANEWFRSLPWDGVDRLPAIYDILGVKDDIEKTMVRKWLVQVVAIQENSDTMLAPPVGVLTFCGRQNSGKTTFLTSLLPLDKRKWVVDGASMNVDNKDDLRKLMSGVIVELGEVDATLKRDQTRLKAVITAPKQSLRLPYDREITTVHSHVSMCASVNEEKFLKDTTGNRRWWVIEPKSKIDLDRLAKLDKEQLWGQIRRIWDASDKTRWWETYGLTDIERAQLEKRNEKFREDSGYEDAIRETFDLASPDRSHRMLATSVALAVINRSTKDEDKKKTSVSKQEYREMSRSLQALGLAKVRTKRGVIYQMPPLLDANELQVEIEAGLLLDEPSTPVATGAKDTPAVDTAKDPLFGDLPEEEQSRLEELIAKGRDAENDEF